MIFLIDGLAQQQNRGAQSKEKANLKKLKQKLFTLIKSKMTD